MIIISNFIYEFLNLIQIYVRRVDSHVQPRG